MKFVLTNDDGYDAPGLEALCSAISSLGEAVVVAPEHPQSGVGHRVTTQDAIAVTSMKPGAFAIDGTPADCARIALTHLCPDADWLVSGINRGGNMGADTYISGTVAAAREAALLGMKSIAVSQYVARGRSVDWEITAARASQIIANLIQRPLDAGEFWNVNLPHPEHTAPLLNAVHCEMDVLPLDVRYRETDGRLIYNGDYHERPRSPGKDVSVCFGGDVAVTRMRI